MVVAANQEVTSSRTPFLTTEWDHGFRSTRIAQRLAKLEKATPADMASVQMDDEDLFARTLVPALLKVPLEVREGETGEQDLLDFTEGARDLLRSWDYSTPASDSDASAAAAYYNAVWRNLCELTFDDELPADMKSDGGARWRAAVTRLLEDPDNAWWDNKLTPNITEGRDEILRQALVEARLELTTELGKDPQGWDWGKLQPADPPAPRPRRRRRRAGAGALAVQRGPLRHAGRLGHRQRQRLEHERGVQGQLGAVDADGRRPLRPRPLDVGQPDRRERPRPRRPLRRPGRRLGRRPAARLAVHGGRGRRDRPGRAHAAPGQRAQRP